MPKLKFSYFTAIKLSTNYIVLVLMNLIVVELKLYFTVIVIVFSYIIYSFYLSFNITLSVTLFAYIIL